MADKRISQLIERVDIANDDVLPIVASGATTTNKVTVSTLQDWMQENLDVGVTSVGITIGSTGTDVNVTGSPVTSSGNITINIPSASATNRGLLSAADWVTFNSKQDAGSFVTLDTAQTITAQKTFTTSGSSDTMIISHGSGSGFALDVLKAGNGEAIRVTKTSGSGNAMTISGGNFEAGTIVKTGGTSTQFLKADGSVDSSTYLTTGSAGSTYVPYSGAAASVNLGAYSITANAINSAGSGSTAGQINLRSDAFFSLVNGYGSISSGTTNQFNLYQTTGAGVFRGAILSLNSITESATRTYTLPDASGTLALSTELGAYLPLAGGTLTGALNGTSASFTGGVTINGLTFVNNTSDTTARLLLRNTTTGADAGGLDIREIGVDASINNASNGSLSLLTNNTTRLTIASTGAATFSSSVTAATLSTIGTAVAATNVQLNLNGVSGKAQRIEFQNSGAQQWLLGAGAASETSAFELFNSTGVISLSINKSTNEATFSSSVSANGGASGVGLRVVNNTNSRVIELGYSTGSGSNFIQAYDGSSFQPLVLNNALTLASTGAATFSSTVETTGIKFPATQVASADANTLDDYEEGTWTPVIVGGTTAGTGTYTAQLGKYTKVGRVVHIYFALAWSAHTGTGKTIVTGFPFASTAGGQTPFAVFTYGETMTAGNVPNGGIMSTGTTQWEHWQVPTGGGITSGIPIYNGAGEIQVSGTYIA